MQSETKSITHFPIGNRIRGIMQLCNGNANDLDEMQIKNRFVFIDFHFLFHLFYLGVLLICVCCVDFYLKYLYLLLFFISISLTSFQKFQLLTNGFFYRFGNSLGINDNIKIKIFWVKLFFSPSLSIFLLLSAKLSPIIIFHFCIFFFKEN